MRPIGAERTNNHIINFVKRQFTIMPIVANVVWIPRKIEEDTER